MRTQRLETMKQDHKKRQDWLANGKRTSLFILHSDTSLYDLGHGEYNELAGEKELFDTTKKSDRIVCHFYRDATMRCKIVDKHLEIIARKHVETKFVKLNVERAPFMVERLHIKTLPTMVLMIDNIVKDKIIGFTDLGNHDEFSTEMLEWRLARGGVIDYKGDVNSPPDAAEKKKTINLFGKKEKTIRGGTNDDDDDDDDD
jgi:hypothetical protein